VPARPEPGGRRVPRRPACGTMVSLLCRQLDPCRARGAQPLARV